jgi:hypothetical protein
MASNISGNQRRQRRRYGIRSKRVALFWSYLIIRTLHRSKKTAIEEEIFGPVGCRALDHVWRIFKFDKISQEEWWTEEFFPSYLVAHLLEIGNKKRVRNWPLIWLHAAVHQPRIRVSWISPKIFSFSGGTTFMNFGFMLTVASVALLVSCERRCCCLGICECGNFRTIDCNEITGIFLFRLGAFDKDLLCYMKNTKVQIL